MSRTITIAPRFNGPPNSGNGGYVSGLLGREIEGAAETTLRASPPLDKPLTLRRENGAAALYDGDTLLGEAKPVAFTLAPPPAPSLAEARNAAKRYLGFSKHSFPTCFVCGPSRPAHDGLDIFSGPVEGRAMVACTWAPGPDLADESGRITEEFIHAALDCPSYWSMPRAGEITALLARMTAKIVGERPRIGEELIVTGWPLRSEGRKHLAATALYHGDGRVIACAEALWIEPKT